MKSMVPLTVILLFAVLASPAAADVPHVITYQGRLTDAGGAPVADGPYLIKFIIWDDPVANAPANEKWNSGFQTVQVQNGLFSYDLGSNVTFPANLFTDTLRWLGITVGTDPEITPRTKLTATSYAHHALRADSASTLGGQAPSYYLDWSNLTGVPAGFADGTDDVGSGDIEGVIAGSGLSGGGTSGDVTIDVAFGGITSDHVADGALIDADISNSAEINPAKISGTAATLSGINHFTNTNYFDPGAAVLISDSTFRADNNGIRIGDNLAPDGSNLMGLYRNFASITTPYGLYMDINNTDDGDLIGVRRKVGTGSVQGDGTLFGAHTIVGSLSGGSGPAYGHVIYVDNNLASSSSRFGVYASVGNISNTGGTSYAFYGIADGSTSYGIVVFGDTYAGYFLGNVHVTGTLSKAGGSFKIDHPLDPEHKYLQHSFVESPDMMNIYNGNVILDVNGEATVTLPDYFEALNMDFRYQLTAIGAPGPNLHIAEKISGNRFRIAGGEPGMEVSWQVTGIRHDKWAEAHRIPVEVEKPPQEVGTYLHPEAWGQPIEKHVNYKEMQEGLERTSASIE